MHATVNTTNTGASQKTSRSYTRTDPVMKYLHAWLTSHRVHMVDWQLRVGDALATAVRGDPHEWQYVHRAYKLLPMDLPLVAAEVCGGDVCRCCIVLPLLLRNFKLLR